MPAATEAAVVEAGEEEWKEWEEWEEWEEEVEAKAAPWATGVGVRMRAGRAMSRMG